MKRHLPLLIFAAALLLRLLVSIQITSGTPSVLRPSPLTDMATYIRLSGEIASGQFPDHYDYQPFYYTVFLPFARIFSGGSLWGPILLQVLLGAGAVWLVWLGAAMAFGRRAGWAAAILLALNRVHIFYTPFMLLEVLQSFWLALIFWVTCLAWRRNRPWLWLADALLLSIATLTRGNALLLFPGFLLLLLCRNWRTNLPSPAKWMRLAALSAGALLFFEAPQLPFAIVNYHYTGRWCGASTAGEKVLALGNTPEAPPGGLEYPLTYHRWVGLAERRPGEGRVSMATSILRWARSEPMVFAELKFRSLLLFWDKQEIPNNVSLLREGRHSFLTRYPVLLPFSIIGPLALLGAFLLIPRIFRGGFHFPYCIILLFMVVISWLGTALFYNLARFRLSALPLLCIAGGAAISRFIATQKRLKRLATEQRKRLVYPMVLLILCSFFIVNTAYTLYQTYAEPAFMRQFRPHGIQCVFPDTTLIYDHGPLSFGGMEYAFPQERGITVTKTFSLGSLSPAGEVRIRIPVITQGPVHARMTHAGQTYHSGDFRLVNDRFMTWLEVTLRAVDPENPSFTWHFPPGQSIGIGMDYCRNYGRTQVDGVPYAAELAAELQWNPPISSYAAAEWQGHPAGENCDDSKNLKSRKVVSAM